MMEIKYKTIKSNSWQLAERYISAKATYTIACPSNRRCQVGMGIFAFGNPLGEKIRFEGKKEITVIGIGSLYFRVDDDKGPCKIGLIQTSITTLSKTFEF